MAAYVHTHQSVRLTATGVSPASGVAPAGPFLRFAGTRLSGHGLGWVGRSGGGKQAAGNGS